MNIIPAIDILDGKCVRLLKGNYSDVTVYNENPIEQVKIFKNAGFKNIHIVDLNAAKTGGDENLEIIQNIACIENIEIQVGGGIRTIEKATQLLSNNIRRIIVGTAAITNGTFRNQLKNNIDVNKIIFGLDFNLSNDTPLLSVNGWTKSTDINLYDYINNNKWIKNILATDISVGKSPTYSLKSDVFIFNIVLEAISIVTVDIVSSITNDSMDEYLSIVFLSPIAALNA